MILFKWCPQCLGDLMEERLPGTRISSVCSVSLPPPILSEALSFLGAHRTLRQTGSVVNPAAA
jgi:hypothetical protein